MCPTATAPLRGPAAIFTAICIATASSSFGQERAPGPSGNGSIRPAPANIANFRPTERGEGIVDPSAIRLSALMESLGEDAILWYQHVQTLSNPVMEGRRPGSRGADMAREYIEFYFREYGLEPPFARSDASDAPRAGDATDARSFQQPFEFRARASFGNVGISNARASIDGEPLVDQEQFVILGNSGEGMVTGPVSFVGYGIEDGENGYSSFDEQTDLTGRIALLLRYEPLDEDGYSQWSDERFSGHSRVSAKMAAVAERGAAGIILVNPPGVKEGRIGLESVRQSASFGRALDVPVAQMTPEVADRLLERADPAGRGLEAWRRRADAGEGTTEHLADAVTVSFGADVRRRTGNVVPAANVGGLLRGSGALADEYVVIGGHQDHVGDGSLGGVNPANRGQLHPGADDNASGTAGVLMLAKKLSERYREAGNDADLRSVLFVTFDAEELGLHGSRQFAQNPPVDADRIAIVLNMDMIGRLREDSLSVFGTGTGAGLEEILRPHFEASGLQVFVSPSGSGRSDDANFHRIEVPAVHFFTGMHAEYTTPADQAHTVNPAGAARIVDLVEGIAMDVATRTDRLTYREPPASRGESRGYARVRLGIRPGMQEQADGGLLVEEVFAGSSAANGGIRKGDVMVGWNSADISGARDLFENLQKHSPGDVVRVVVRRDGEEVELRITLKSE
jgi:hypothetical protein